LIVVVAVVAILAAMLLPTLARSKQTVSWTASIHVNQGNLGLTDGSVQQLSSASLRNALRNSGDVTNVWRIALSE